MGSLLQQVLTILTTTPGNLTYHLVLAFSIAGALQGAFNLWRNSGFPQGRRMVIGLSLLLLARLGLFLVAGASWQGIAFPVGVLATLDRAATAFGLILIIWMWAFPESSRPADAATLLLVLVGATLAIFTGIWSSNQLPDAAYNGSPPDLIWGGLALLLILIGFLMLLIRQPNGWGSGLGMLGLLFAGHLGQMIAPLPEGDYPGFVRMAQIAAYPLLLTLPQRFPVAQPVVKAESSPVIQERRRYSTEPKVFQALLSLITGDDPLEICRAITSTISQAMLADFCILLRLPEDEGEIAIQCGYDLIGERPVASLQIDSRQAPMLARALRRGLPLRLPASSTSVDLVNLSQALHLERASPLLAVPFHTPDEQATWGIVLLSPHSNRNWSSADEITLLNITKLLAHLKGFNGQINELEEELARARQASQDFQNQAEQAHAQNEAIRSQLQTLQAQSEQSQVEVSSLAALISAQEAAQETIAQLRAENEKLSQATHDLPDGTEAAPDKLMILEKDLESALEEVDLLQIKLKEADGRIRTLEESATPPPEGSDQTAAQAEYFASISQELRQPLSSMSGYTDLLLSESVGILGALQRKFLERIKASAERMGGLIEDLVQATMLETDRQKLTAIPIDFSTVIDEAIAVTAPQIREKRISLRLDLPGDFPQIKADPDALQQVLINLLQNAGSATPSQGEICLRGRVEQGEDHLDYIFIQVSDMGGGIPPSDLPRVFSRLYRNDNILIQGVGDTGMGLSMVKTLIEAHGGRIWVDTEMGKGSTFSVLLPVSDQKLSPDGYRGRMQ